MSYSDDPIGNPIDTVRLLIGDTRSPEQLTDNEIMFLLTDADGGTREAAARACETLAARYGAELTEKQVGPLRITTGTRSVSRAAQYLKLAKYLWAQAFAANTVPYAGGISKADKASKASDTDRVAPAFGRDMMKYPAVLPAHEEDRWG